MKHQFSTPEAEKDYKKFKAANDKKYKMKTLNDLGLRKKTHEKVEAWLQEWLELFIKQADGKQGWVYRANFANNDFFYFTDCKDILEKDPEAKGQENNLDIRRRKRKVLLQLFVKTLLGKKLGTTITCNHCGFSPCWIEGLKDGNGHWVYCPKCKKTDIHVFPEGYDNCMETIQTEITKRTLPDIRNTSIMPANMAIGYEAMKIKGSRPANTGLGGKALKKSKGKGKK